MTTEEYDAFSQWWENYVKSEGLDQVASLNLIKTVAMDAWEESYDHIYFSGRINNS